MSEGNLKIIHLEKVKELPISAASGLLKKGSCFYVVADDENSLFRFSLETSTVDEIMIRPSRLPQNAKDRKRLKADWESLAFVPDAFGAGRILVVPSGSSANRREGFLVSADPLMRRVTPVDFSVLYLYLEKIFPDLNIEGAVITASTIQFLQRGNGGARQNALVTLSISEAFAQIEIFGEILPTSIVDIETYDLGSLRGNFLSFTDGFFLDRELFFLAVCEETNSTFDDGPFRAAGLGKIDARGKLQRLGELDCPFKPEGLWMEKVVGETHIYVVTDADSRRQPSNLYFGKIQIEGS